MLYNVINMSDRYTIDCPDLEIAFVCCALLGEGQYAFEPIEGDGPAVPMFLTGGSSTRWVAEHFDGKTVDDIFTHVTRERRGELADALDSIVISDREEFQRRTAGLSGDDFLAARAKWQDERRSSMNNIGGRAYRAAAQMRKDLPLTDRAPRQVFAV